MSLAPEAWKALLPVLQGPADGRGQATAGTSLGRRPCPAPGPHGNLTSKARANSS
jgi:hypothetical protein